MTIVSSAGLMPHGTKMIAQPTGLKAEKRFDASVESVGTGAKTIEHLEEMPWGSLDSACLIDNYQPSDQVLQSAVQQGMETPVDEDNRSRGGGAETKSLASLSTLLSETLDASITGGDGPVTMIVNMNEKLKGPAGLVESAGRRQPDFCEKAKLGSSNCRFSDVQLADGTTENGGGEWLLHRDGGENPQTPVPMDIIFPDGTGSTILDVTEKLKRIVPVEDIERNGVLHRRSIPWRVLVMSLKELLKTFENGIAEAFVSTLVNRKIICPVPLADAATESGGSAGLLYRLKCEHTPWVLNSYCDWHFNAAYAKTIYSAKPEMEKWEELFHQLERMLKEMGVPSSFGPEGIRTLGELCVRTILEHKLFPRFEETLCEFQVLSPDDIVKANERLAVGMNVYMVMMQYACLKLGVFDSSDKTSQESFLKRIKFNVGGKLYSFASWEDWILCGIDNKDASGEADSHASTASLSKSTESFASSRKVGEVLERSKTVQLALRAGWANGSTQPLPFTFYSPESVLQEIDLAVTISVNDDANVFIDTESAKVFLSLELSVVIARVDKDLIKTILPLLDSSKQMSFAEICMGSKKLEVIYDGVECGVERVTTALQFNEDSLEMDTVLPSTPQASVRHFERPKAPADETLRLKTLRAYKLLDSDPEERFDRITAMVQSAFNVQVVLISLVDEDRVFFKSKQWSSSTGADEEAQIGRDVSFSGHAILGDDILYVPDATEDARFADNPLVTGPLGIRFYAGCNLTVPAFGRPDKTVNIGTLCIIDQKPRIDFDAEQQQILRSFALQVQREVLAEPQDERRTTNGSLKEIPRILSPAGVSGGSREVALANHQGKLTAGKATPNEYKRGFADSSRHTHGDSATQLASSTACHNVVARPRVLSTI